MEFTARHTGLEGHGTGVTQSMWDEHGRRVQFGWIGTPFSAAQTLPHEIRLSESGDSLEWLPLPEMARAAAKHFLVLLCAARTLNAIGPSRVSLSLR